MSDDNSDLAFLALVQAIAAREEEAVSALIGTTPGIARMAALEGACRQSAKSYVLNEIDHYLCAGDTALHIAAAAYWIELVDKLIANGADVRARDRHGAEPLHYAVDAVPGSHIWNPTAQAAILRHLLQAGADPNCIDRRGVAPDVQRRNAGLPR